MTAADPRAEPRIDPRLDPRIDPALRSAIVRLATVPRLLVALDFDGTLAPEVDDPERARALPAARAAIAGLRARPGTTVALVSGRALDSLARVAEADADLPLVGSHGLEVRFAAGDAPAALAADEVARLARLRARIAPLVAAVAGARIEDKPAGLAVHVRGVERGPASALDAAVRAALADETDLTLRAGKNVVELALRDATKADGLRALRGRFPVDAVLYAGDDVTDEDALAALGPHDVGIRVGPGPTVAAHRVADPASMAAVLSLLMSARESPGSAR